MSEDTARDDIRKLLKTFGIQADEAVIRHLERMPEAKTLKVRLRLEDLTDYGNRVPDKPLMLSIEGEIRS
ncbi:MAG: hypothetical protein PVF85_04890 [Anaerolineales bacterium]|jgi:hypothetical protein